MKRIECHKTKKNERDVLQIIPLLLVLPTVLRAQNTLGCSDLTRTNKCSCYTFEDGVFVDCQYTDLKDIKNALKSMPDIHSLSVYDLDDNENALAPNFIPQAVCIKHIHISRTNIKDIGDDTFMPLRKCLETLTIVSSKLKVIPQKVLSGMLKLTSINFKSNYIEEIASYSFYSLPLIKLNIKANVLRDISDTAFSSLELSLSQIDLSENNLTTFPITALANLRHLQSLTLAWNEIASFPSVENSDLISLEYLNLNSNNFEFISEDCLKFCPSLVTLSFHFNFINSVHYKAFYSLVNLKSLDLSYNRIKVLNPYIFQNNQFLVFVDLSFNHLHHIHGLFCNLPSLINVVLSHNNILDVPIDSFLNSNKIETIHLDKNCISSIHIESFSNLVNIVRIQLEFNYLNQVPHNVFINNRSIMKLRLDNNMFSEINNNTLESLINLNEIRFNNNRLRFVSKYYFTKTLKVEDMYLDHNEITFIESEIFVNMKNLKYLSLNNNYLIDLNNILPKYGSNLLMLHLEFNSLSLLSNVLFQSQKQLNHLSLKHNRIKFVTNNTFRNLSLITRLELNNNEISIIEDFSLQQINSTRHLDLQYNFLRNITNYTFFGLGELEDLDISYNTILFIFNMAFDTLKKLRSLNLSYNPLKVLNRNIFQQGLPLSSLFLDNCAIEHIENDTFFGLNNLKLLSLKNNSIQSSGLASINISSLKYLALSYNMFNYLPIESFSQLPLLEVLVLEHCNIEHIFEGTFKFNKNLLRLNLAQNIINAIPSNLFNAGQSSIIDFNISNNFLDYVPYDIFTDFTDMETLDMTDNLLPRIELSGLEKLTKLKYLILRKNEINSVTARKKMEFTDLISFDISNNRLDNLPLILFDIFPNILYVNISNNYIVHFEFLVSYRRLGISLINIDLSRNPAVSWKVSDRVSNNSLVGNLFELYICFTNMTNIDDITFELFTNLRHLYLKFNKIRRLAISPFAKLTLLENLDLGHNRISQLKTSNFRGLTKLRTLCLSNNNIESMESFAEELNGLKLLDLSHNKIQNILNEDLINLKDLTVLNLSYNNIKYISVTAFGNLNKVIKIDLEHNKLQTIPLELLNSIESHIQEIIIGENNIICNCQKNNTWMWIQDHPKIIKPTSVSCLNNEYPKEKCNMPVISQLSVNNHKDNSVSVSWFIRNRTAIKGLQILYYGDANSNVHKKNLEKNEVSARITDLESNMNYVVCIVTLSDDSMEYIDEIDSEFNVTINDSNNNHTAKISQDIAAAMLRRSPSSECISFNTFRKQAVRTFKSGKKISLSSILNRRLGLIIGCVLGIIVFFVMVSVLLYTKIKERKRIAKSDPAWSELNDYQSMASKDDILHDSTTASTDNILLGMSKSRKLSLDQLA